MDKDHFVYGIDVSPDKIIGKPMRKHIMKVINIKGC